VDFIKLLINFFKDVFVYNAGLKAKELQDCKKEVKMLRKFREIDREQISDITLFDEEHW